MMRGDKNRNVNGFNKYLGNQRNILKGTVVAKSEDFFFFLSLKLGTNGKAGREDKKR